MNWRERRERERELPRAIEDFRRLLKLDRNGVISPLGSVDAEVVRRREEITMLPTVIFKGRTLKRVRCVRCNRDRNVPGSVLWLVISVKRFICAWCLTRG